MSLLSQYIQFYLPLKDGCGLYAITKFYIFKWKESETLKKGYKDGHI